MEYNNTVWGFVVRTLETLHAPFTLLSLGLTWPGLVVAVLVLVTWHSTYIRWCVSKDRSPQLTLIAGVYLSFVGFTVDNSWWGIAWSLDYIDPGYGHIHYWRNFFFHYGVFSNVFFRQGLGLLAGLLHVHADNMSRDTPLETRRAGLNLKRILGFGVTFGALYVVCMVWLKGSI